MINARFANTVVENCISQSALERTSSVTSGPKAGETIPARRGHMLSRDHESRGCWVSPIGSLQHCCHLSNVGDQKEVSQMICICTLSGNDGWEF